MIEKRHLHRWKVPKRCFIVYSKSRFLRQADFLRCLDTYLYAWSWIYEQSLICYFLNIVLVYPVSVDRQDRGHDRGTRCCLGAVYAGRDRGRKFQKIGAQHDGKNLFCAFFLIFSKNLSALKTCIFACFRLFCEPLRARAFSLSLKKLPPNFFWKRGLTLYAQSAILWAQSRNGTPPDALTGTALTV